MLCLRSLFISAILFILLTSSLVYGATITPKDYYSKHEIIISEIKSRGAKAVVAELTKDWNVWDSVCDKIATGDQAWLKTAVALQAGTDAGASETLDLALGEALEHNPGKVFKIAGKYFDLESICGGPDVDNARYNSYKLSMKAINLRINKVTNIKDHSLQKMSKECIRYLEDSKKDIADFYQVKGK